MTFECLEKIYSSSEKMQQLGRLVITTTMVLKDKWQSQLVKLTPRERFINFVTKHPELMQRVPQKYLASYLNIKPETFSRFKHMVKEYSKKISFIRTNFSFFPKLFLTILSTHNIFPSFSRPPVYAFFW